jgi:rhamnosyltransferase subunit B
MQEAINPTSQYNGRRIDEGKRIILATFGSLGDVHPYIALALELRRRGHRPVIATSEIHRQIAEAEGIEFHAVRPDITDFGSEVELMEKVMNLKSGPEYVIRELMMPHLRASYESLNAACDGADLLVSHPLTFTAPIIAEQRRSQGMAWASVSITPAVLLSAHDPPVFAPAPWLRHARVLGPGVNGLLLRGIIGSTHNWVKPWHQLRADLGLPRTSTNPIFGGQFSPELNLALFSALLAPPQPDWPPNTIVTGFPFYDRRGEAANANPDATRELEAFLAAGESPIVFTLGSSAVMKAGNFYSESAKAASKLGKRALLLVGRDPRNRFEKLPDGVAAFEYAPFSKVLPHALAVVHQGGVGTTAQSMRAGHPMLVVPFGFDQPDNAARVVRLGIARTLARAKYNAESAARELGALLSDANYVRRAKEVGARIRAENGAGTACDAMESLLERTHAS